MSLTHYLHQDCDPDDCQEVEADPGPRVFSLTGDRWNILSHCSHFTIILCCSIFCFKARISQGAILTRTKEHRAWSFHGKPLFKFQDCGVKLPFNLSQLFNLNDLGLFCWMSKQPRVISMLQQDTASKSFKSTVLTF